MVQKKVKLTPGIFSHVLSVSWDEKEKVIIWRGQCSGKIKGTDWIKLVASHLPPYSHNSQNTHQLRHIASKVLGAVRDNGTVFQHDHSHWLPVISLRTAREVKDSFFPDSKLPSCPPVCSDHESSCLVGIMAVVMSGPMLASLLVISMLKWDHRVKSKVGRGLGARRKCEENAQIQPLKKTCHGTGQNETVGYHKRRHMIGAEAELESLVKSKVKATRS